MDIQSNIGETAGPDLWLVKVDDLPAVWPAISQLLHRTPDDGALANWEEDELYNVLVKGMNYGVIIGWDSGMVEAVMIVYYDKTPNDLVLWIESGNGKLRKYLPYLEKIERWAHTMEASAVKIRGSKALTRIMKSSGYGITEYVLSKPIRKLWSH